MEGHWCSRTRLVASERGSQTTAELLSVSGVPNFSGSHLRQFVAVATAMNPSGVGGQEHAQRVPKLLCDQRRRDTR